MKIDSIPSLKRAVTLIKANKLDEASKIIARILKANPDDQHAWYLLSFSVTDTEKKVYSLQRVLQINPTHPKARARLTRITDTMGNAPVQARLAVQPASAHSSAGRPAAALDRRSLARAFERQRARPIRSISDVLKGRKVSLWERLRRRIILSWRRSSHNWRIFTQNRLAVIGIVLVFMFAIMAIVHPLLLKTVWPRGIYDPLTGFDIHVSPHPAPPSSAHIFGTDTLGRDILSMLLAATTPTFVIGLTAAITTAFVGTIMSMLAAYFRGSIDAIITNLADVFILFPAPIIMIIIGARFRDLGPVHLGLIYGLVTGAGGTTIVMRSHALSVVSKPYMQAAKIAGGGAGHIITKHLLPGMMPLAALQMMVAVSGAVVADGFISFFGITRVSNNWGTLIYDAFIYKNVTGLTTEMWQLLVPAAMCFSLFALGFYLISRGLHEVASPKIRIAS